MMNGKVFLTVAATALAALAASATTINQVNVTCGNCGAENTVIKVGSTNQMQAPDLDWRPGEMMRSTLVHAVHECSKCHYCATDLSEKPKSEAAKKIIAAPMPGSELADRFARAAAIQAAEASAAEGYEKKSTLMFAGYLFHCAAWCCDDKDNAERAVAYRREALKYFEQWAKAEIRDKSEIEPDFLMMLCDLYRRVGDFGKAEKTAQAVLAHKSLPQRMAELQLRLCREKKTDRHTIGEIPEYADNYTTIFL